MDAALFMRATGCNRLVAQAWCSAISNAMAEHDIATPARQAAFLAQCGHESMGFTRTREIWGPTPAQERYEGRADLGNTQQGDGFRFRGRGLIHLTGRANYRACSNVLDQDFEAHPDMLEVPAYAARSAAWYWQEHNLNALADAGKFELLTRRINGGLNGYADRTTRWYRARNALGA